MPPGPDPAGPGDGLVKVPTTPIRQVGAQGSADTYLGGPLESRRPSCWRYCAAVTGKAAARLVPLRTCRLRASGRFVSPQRSGSARARRPRAEKPELVAEASGAPWRLRDAARTHPGDDSFPGSLPD